MIIKKIDDEITYKRITRTHEFEFENGKKVRVYQYDNYDSISNDYEQDYDIDEQDKIKLTEDELEVFEDSICELFELEVGVDYNLSN